MFLFDNKSSYEIFCNLQKLVIFNDQTFLPLYLVFVCLSHPRSRMLQHLRRRFTVVN